MAELSPHNICWLEVELLKLWYVCWEAVGVKTHNAEGVGVCVTTEDSGPLELTSSVVGLSGVE